jgi:large subunit ribosomal protein L23Ae
VPAAKTDAKAKAAQAAKAVKKGTYTKKARKPRYSVVFHRPKTLKRARNPKYLRTR